MSRKSVLSTLKKSNVFFNLQSFNNTLFPFGFDFLKNFKTLFFKKSVLITNENLNYSNNNLNFTLDLFFETKKLKYYKKRSFFYHGFIIVQHKKTINSLLLKLTKKLRTNSLFLQINVLNNFVDIKVASLLFVLLKRYLNILFLRRFNLYIDLVKLTSLYLNKKISINAFLQVITHVFKNLRKKNHSSFLLFFEELFLILVEKQQVIELSLLGIKLLITGRLKGKPRSSNFCIKVGCIPSQTFSSKIDYAKAHTFTNKFGVFGFKLWVNRKN